MLTLEGSDGSARGALQHLSSKNICQSWIFLAFQFVKKTHDKFFISTLNPLRKCYHNLALLNQLSSPSL